MYWIAFGDVHESTTIIEAIPGIREADGIIITGDLTNRGQRQQAERVISAARAANPTLLAQPGNMDTTEVTQYLEEQGVLMHRQVTELAPGLALLAVGYSTPTPFGTPGEVEETEIAQWLQELDAASAHYERRILIIHEPPKDSACDHVGDGLHVGSQAVREFIEQTNLDLVVTGHIHESTGQDELGGTPVFNPGMVSGGGFVRIAFDGESVTATLESV